MKILAIETSCDETAAAILTERDTLPVLLSNIVSSQIEIHARYGGVIPEVAARAHIESILPVIEEALAEANTKKEELTHIVVTAGPGLIGSLVVGTETAKALGTALGIPVVPVNHLEGHIYSNFIKETPKFPLITLLVSGGHTMLIHMQDHLNYEIIGKTRDDAAGEAFDKAAKAMGLPYPGGPVIAKLAATGNAEKYTFPIVDLTPLPERNEEGFLTQQEASMDFSFSGLKTALISRVKELTRDGKKLTATEQADLSASFQATVVKTLIQNSLRAIERYQPQTFILSGGVAANRELREELGKALSNSNPGISYCIPEITLCTDNAAMIGAAGYFHIANKKIDPLISADPNATLN